MIERPLDADAVREADEQIYANHANDPRPNPLYDAQGNRLKLDSTDPDQEDLRQEWRDLYTSALAKKKQQQQPPPQPPPQRPAGRQPVKKSTSSCPPTHWIKISLLKLDDLQARPDWWAKKPDRPYPNENFRAEITDGEKTGALDGQGSVRYDQIPEGVCQIQFTNFYKLIEDKLGAPDKWPVDALPSQLPGAAPPAATPKITIQDPKAVAVRRDYLDQLVPKVATTRLPVQLGIDGNYDGSGTLDSAQSDTIRVFDAATDGNLQALPWKIPSSDLTAGKTVYVEGVKPSASLNGTELTLTLSEGSLPVTQASASDKLTAVLATLDICDVHTDPDTEPAALADDKKRDPGRVVQFQDAKWNARALVFVRQTSPADFAGKLVLSPLDDKVKLFWNETVTSGEAEIATPFEIDIATISAPGTKMYAAGVKFSTAMHDTGLKLGIKTLTDEADRVAITVGPRLDVIVDKDKNRVVDENEPITKFVRIGLWDQAYDGAGNVRNGVAEADNFIGSDYRRFYFRVNDAAAAGSSVNINWKTLKADDSDDDSPASLVLTLQETSAGSKCFVSKAVMLVTDDTDRDQATDSGLTAPLPDVGVRNRGDSNHRLRKAAIDGSVKGEYTPTGFPLVSAKVPVFNRDPDERRRVSVAVINYDSVATNAYILGQFAHANTHWNRVGIQIDAQATVNRPSPAGVLDGAGQYTGSLDNAAEQAALADLIPIAADGTLTVVFVPLSGANAYATVGQRQQSALGDRFFIFVNDTLALTDETLAHELHHVLFNRFDTAVAQQFYTFNTNPPGAFGIALPDVRIYGRIQNLNSADPDNDASNDNILNWPKRARTARFPIGAGTSAATATTGNKFAQNY